MDNAREDILEQIDQYLNGTMTSDVRVLFEEKLAQDASLQALLEKSEAIREILADYKAQEFKQKFARIAQHDHTKKLWTRGSIMAILALSSLGISYHFLFNNNEQAKTPTALTLDTLKAIKQTEVSIVQSQPSTSKKTQVKPSPKNTQAHISKEDEPKHIAPIVDPSSASSTLPKAPESEMPKEIVTPSVEMPTNKKPQAFDCSQTMITFALVSKPSCKGQHTGQIMLQGNPEGGKSPYAWHIENNGLTYNGVDLAEGNYTVIVKDHNGCIAQKPVSVSSKICVTTHEYSLDPHSGHSLELGTANTAVTLQIRNKAGLLQFQAQVAQGETISWNGVANTGDVVPNGVYLYSIIEGSELIEKGYITIVSTH